MLRRLGQAVVSSITRYKVKMTEISPSINQSTSESKSSDTHSINDSCGDKRHLDEKAETTEQPDSKKPKTDMPDGDQNGEEKKFPYKKKKMAMFLVYSGKGYLGMQKNPDAKTIEGDLLNALLKAGVVTQEHIASPGPKMFFQRAARTDKGVSAAGQLHMFIDVDNPMEKINANLVDQIRVIGIQKATKKFDSKNAANARTYFYMIPTFSFAPCEQITTEDYRVTDEIVDKVNETLKIFKGTHNFHNYTSGKKPTDPSAKRYIMEFKIGRPFEREGMEFAIITVKGQSFILHQIRKMIGLTIAVVRGLASPDVIEKTWGTDKYDVPKAPGLGLVLDKVHYDYYNKRFGKDGFHEPILWERYQEVIENFKEKQIYPTIIQTEKDEKSMLYWLSTLSMHHFGVIEDLTRPLSAQTPVGEAARLLYTTRKAYKEDCNQKDHEESTSEVIPNSEEVTKIDQAEAAVSEKSSSSQISESNIHTPSETENSLSDPVTKTETNRTVDNCEESSSVSNTSDSQHTEKISVDQPT